MIDPESHPLAAPSTWLSASITLSMPSEPDAISPCNWFAVAFGMTNWTFDRDNGNLDLSKNGGYPKMAVLIEK